MPFGESVVLELIKSVFSLIPILIAAAIAARFGRNVSFWWAVRQKHRELDLQLARQFDERYGELVAVLRLWRAAVERYGLGYDRNPTRWDLLERATRAESGIEAVLLTFSSERKLSTDDVMLLAAFRQACQTVRESIRDGDDMAWWQQKNVKYQAFKRLAAATARQLVAGEPWSPPNLRGVISNRLDTPGIPSRSEAEEHWQTITSNARKDDWWEWHPERNVTAQRLA